MREGVAPSAGPPRVQERALILGNFCNFRSMKVSGFKNCSSSMQKHDHILPDRCEILLEMTESIDTLNRKGQRRRSTSTSVQYP